MNDTSAEEAGCRQNIKAMSQSFIMAAQPPKFPGILYVIFTTFLPNL